MNKKQVTALDDYINKVYTIALLAISGACQAAGLLYTLEKIFGLFPTVEWWILITFDVTCLFWLAVSVFFVKTGYEDKLVKPRKLKHTKIFLTILEIVQWNFILYMMPLENFWAFMFFFVALEALFLDYKLIAFTEAGLFISLVISWFVNGADTLPVKDAMFVPAMLNKTVCLILSMAALFMLVYLVNRFLVRAKKDELEKNNERVQNMLLSVSELSDKLCGAGDTLSDISQNESSSAEELAATSENLLTNNNELGQKSDESIENLNELQKWEQVVNEQMSRVETSSRHLLDKSKENESRLKLLKEITGEVSVSMENTNEVSVRLSEAVKEIDVALKVISDISSSTDLLSLNASIEAARAGEAGKGFAVVAQSVGGLARDTQESVAKVGAVIEKIQQSVAEMTDMVNDNTLKLARQNEYFNEVFSGMQEMISILNSSMEDIRTMGEAHDRQAGVIRSTVEINRSIAERIKRENAEYANINIMVESNANDIEQMTEQVAVLNQMVEQINQLLSQQD